MATKTVEGNELRDLIASRAYYDADFRASLINDPKASLENVTGTELPEAATVTVHEESADSVHLVIPAAPAEELSDDQLQAVAGGFLDAQGAFSSVFGDPMYCTQALIASKIEVNL